MAELSVTRWGNGEPVVLVHGSVFGGEGTWAAQKPLADAFGLIVPDRRGFGQSPPAEGEDFLADADDVIALLGSGAHLAGHSYGGVVSLVAACRRPDLVRSLTVFEPPAFGLARGVPAVEDLVGRMEALFSLAPELSPADFLPRFVRTVGGDPRRLPDPLPEGLVHTAGLLMRSRLPWTAEIPLKELAAHGVPTLVVSGGHSEAFDAVLDVLERELSATRVTAAGAGHSVPTTGPAVNGHLRDHWTAAAR